MPTELTEAQVAAELAANEKAIAKFAEQIAAQKSPAEATADAAAKAAADAAEAAKAAAAASTPAAVNIETTIGPYGLTARELEGARDSLQEFGFSRDEIAAIEKGLPPITPRFKRDVEIRYKRLSRGDILARAYDGDEKAMKEIKSISLFLSSPIADDGYDGPVPR